MKNFYLNIYRAVISLFLIVIFSSAASSRNMEESLGKGPSQEGNFFQSLKTEKEAAYTVLKTFSLPSLEAEVFELEHKRSGAKLVLVKNSDPSRTFMVSFRTPPYDNTGLPHIFEHAVLQGSRLFPSKRTFSKIWTSTLASFVNAMTGPVSTFYPFVTKDSKDFRNLLLVYMDAVFFPKAIEDPRIIKREGWRYTVNPETGEMVVNGIVFNEMKGMFSKPDKYLSFHLSRSVLPQTPYSYESGGLPEEIPKLKFEQIVEAHKKNYHPQNSLIYLYGDLDYEKTLTTIDSMFLSHFEKSPDFTPEEITLQTDFNYPSLIVERTYPGSRLPNRETVVKSYVLGPLTSAQANISFVLMNAFATSNSSPLRLRILNEGLATSFSVSVGDNGQNNMMSFIFKGTDSSKLEKIDRVINEELDKVITEGVDKEFLEATLNTYEFYEKNSSQNGSHRGFNVAFSVVDNWIYPIESLEASLDFIDQFERLRKDLQDEDLIKSFFRKYIKENSHFRWLVIKPDPELFHKIEANMKSQVEEALKIKPLNEYAKEDQTYREWVESIEPPEVTDKTPLLDLSDITVDEKPLSFRRFKVSSTEILEYPQATGGISYVQLFFDLRGVEAKNLKNLTLMNQLLEKTDTTNYSFQDLLKKIKANVGQLSFKVSTFNSVKDPEKFRPTLIVNLSFLDKNRDKSFSLLKEVLTETQFSPVSHVDRLLKAFQGSMAESVASRGMDFVTMAAAKPFYPNPVQGVFHSQISGVPFEKYMSTDIDPNILVSQLKLMLKNIFHRDRLYLATVTGDSTELKGLGFEVEKLKNSIFLGDSPDKNWNLPDQENYDGYAIPGGVQYISQVAPIKGLGLEYKGSLAVYSQYLGSEYMIPYFRERGGAYGAYAYFSRKGFFVMSSYRDPNLKKSLDLFSNVTNFMESQEIDQRNLRSAQLGALKSYYKDRGVEDETDLMTSLYLRNLNWGDYLKFKREILSTTPEDFKKITQALALALKNAKTSVAGDLKKMKEEAPFLENIFLFESK